jgi:transposase
MIRLSSDQELQLRIEATNTNDLRVYRRATALLALHDGVLPRQVASVLGISRQTVYNWIKIYGRPDERIKLADSPRSGRPTVWTEELKMFIHRTMNQSPTEFGHDSLHWTAKTLQSHLASVQETYISKEALRRYLRLLGYKWEKGRYTFHAYAFGSTC